MVFSISLVNTFVNLATWDQREAHLIQGINTTSPYMPMR